MFPRSCQTTSLPAVLSRRYLLKRLPTAPLACRGLNTSTKLLNAYTQGPATLGKTPSKVDADKWSQTFHALPGSKRTHNCGALRVCDVGTEVVLCGWALSPRKIGADIAFLPLRDAFGSTQLVHELNKGATEGEVGLRDRLLNVTPETILCARGVVRKRPADAVNKELDTGEIEVLLRDLQILNPANPLPFSTSTRAQPPSEETRLKYRYVDLRRPKMQSNIRKRSMAAHVIRSYLHSNGFIEVETPLLFKSTPEGAREFIVPTRQKGQFYALPQSPQQYKQVLMSAGFERYFQIAKCFRDESLGADRQPEFTQIDLEMSFVGMEDIMVLMEGLVSKIWKDVGGVDVSVPFRRITYDEAMSRYGSDKPDTRFGMEICNLTPLLGEPDASGGEIVEAFCVKNGGKILKNKEIEKVKEILLNEQFPLLGGSIDPRNVMFIKINESQKDWITKLKITSNPVSPEKLENINTGLGGVDSGDLIFVNRRIGGYIGPHTVAGRARLHIARILTAAGQLSMENQLNFLWVHSFPLFTPSVYPTIENTPAMYESTHHPFTAPVPSSLPHLQTSPGSVLGQHYDLVLNGQEIGGGSIRVHDPRLQEYIFSEILRIPSAKIERDFGHLLDALRYGCPPHGGIALGFDRLMAILCDAGSIRDVIAFPKLSGGDLFVDSPAEVPEEALQEYHLKVLP